MQKKFLIFILITILFITISCQRTGVGVQRIEEEFHIGTQGLEMNFLNNAPPNRIYDGDNLEVVVELRNKGAYPTSDIFDGKLEITGFDPSAINGVWEGGNLITTRLQGKSQFIPDGGYATMTYRDNNGVNVPFDSDKYEPEILLTACYKYKTIASPKVCVDPDPYRVVQERKVCEIRDQSLGSQGAPVSVTNLEEEVSSDKIHFRIFIQNAGDGEVIETTAFSDCPFDIEHEELNKVIVRAQLPYDTRPECSPRGTATDPVRLVNGKGVIFCSFNKPATNSAYETTLQVELEYIYSTSISKKIEIINLR